MIRLLRIKERETPGFNFLTLGAMGYEADAMTVTPHYKPQNSLSFKKTLSLPLKSYFSKGVVYFDQRIVALQTCIGLASSSINFLKSKG